MHTTPKRMSRLVTALALSCAAALVAATTATPAVATAAAAGTPVATAVADPTVPTLNDWDCRPSAAHPTPVIVVHGTMGDSVSLLENLEAALLDGGYCVFALDYGNRGTGPIEDSAAELSTYVDRVLAATHAKKVSFVGHSQGGMMPRYYLKYLGGQDKVDDLVGLAPSNHGTYHWLLLGIAGIVCPACAQQGAGSPFITDLNWGDETPGDVSYTNVITQYDEVVVPANSGYLSGFPDQVSNLKIQSYCPFTVVEHIGIPGDQTAIAMALDALSHPGPAQAWRSYPCS
ncbi:esterase/lipase family protein [Pimelobacter simplex]|uniref:esterase/lipase family protein n=1 Tax=Nocardioides simplex TaxID=2045 RepID=UPI0019329044|nr:alpha/beta fold hydrolase [Pimelobacter simplex]